MPALGLSAAIRKASEAGRRAAALARARPAMVRPAASYSGRPIDGVLVLQRGDNASTDYYLRPRLTGLDAPVAVADIAGDPARCTLLTSSQALLVIVCRYISPAWLAALEGGRERLARVAFFADDDLPGMLTDRSLPLAVRGKVASHYARHVERLDALASEVWVSTPALAERYPQSRPAVLAPVPEADYASPSAEPPPLVVYHSTDVHGRERAFVAEVAERLAELSPDAVVEMTGTTAERRRFGGLATLRIVGQQPWPAYREAQAGRAAAASLAPLMASEVNAARAPVKAFDAARLGAAGLYADVAPYSSFIRDGDDGLLLPMQAEAWAEAIASLLEDPARRLRLARAAHGRMLRMRHDTGGLPPAPSA
jgi:hypothetical protein